MFISLVNTHRWSVEVVLWAGPDVHWKVPGKRPLEAAHVALVSKNAGRQKFEDVRMV